MRIFGKALKPYLQNGELREHCGADSCAIRAKLSAIICAKFQKIGRRGELAVSNFIKFRAHFAASGTLCPPAASTFYPQNGYCVAQFMKVCV